MSEARNVTVVSTHKDRLFKIIFNDKENLLNLYNSLANTSYDDADALEINTLEDVIYISMKNDLSFLLDGRLSLYEQQSAINPNMPLRGLYYITDLYKQKYSGKQLYSSKLLKIPTPQYIVFYNGEKEMPDKTDYHLSDAFEHPTCTPDVEVIAHVININIGHNATLLEKCKTLLDYSTFNQRIRDNLKNKLPREQAIGLAIDSCIADGILEDILRKEKVKIMASILAEFDEVGYAQMLKEEGIEEGIYQGEYKKLIELICKKLRKNKSPKLISEELEEDISTIDAICKLAQKYAPDYNAQKIYEEWFQGDI